MGSLGRGCPELLSKFSTLLLFLPPPLSRPGPHRLHCLGPLRERLSIWAAMDSIPGPSSGQGHHLTDDSREPENWQNTGDYSRDGVSQPQMALEEVRPEETAGSWDKVGQSLKPREPSFPCPFSLPGARPTSKQPKTVTPRILEGTLGTVGRKVLGQSGTKRRNASSNLHPKWYNKKSSSTSYSGLHLFHSLFKHPRNQPCLPNTEPDQALPSASQKHLNKVNCNRVFQRFVPSG